MLVTVSEERTHQDIVLSELQILCIKIKTESTYYRQKKKNDHMWTVRGLL